MFYFTVQHTNRHPLLDRCGTVSDTASLLGCSPVMNDENFLVPFRQSQKGKLIPHTKHLKPAWLTERNQGAATASAQLWIPESQCLRTQKGLGSGRHSNHQHHLPPSGRRSISPWQPGNQTAITASSVYTWVTANCLQLLPAACSLQLLGVTLLSTALGSPSSDTLLTLEIP